MDGSVSTAWEDPDNWSCGSVPDSHTAVQVPAGLTNYPVVSTTVSCRQLHVSPGVAVKIASGANLLITGP